VKVKYDYLPSLTGWRGLAISGTLLCHSSVYLFAGTEKPGFFTQLMQRIASNSGTMIYVFFGISGLLITTRLMNEKDQTGSIDLKDFYLRRVARIIPAALFYLVGLAALSAIFALGVNHKDWLGAVFMYRNYLVVGQESPNWFTGHYWSLSVEEHFYLVWPTTLAFFLAHRWLKPAVVGLCVATMIWRYIDSKFGISVGVLGYSNSGFRTDTCIDFLLYSALAALLLTNPKLRPRITRWFPPAALGIGIAIFSASFYIPVTSLRHTVMGLSVPIVLLSTTLNPKFFISRMLESEPLQWLGKLSYSIYLWQQLFLPPPTTGTHLFSPQGNLPWALLSILVCASISYYVVENPIRRWAYAKIQRQKISAIENPEKLVANM
jgi:peptidoglycan/LPS O-acetylase OafA/YrhL